jgi:hypothetical protein
MHFGIPELVFRERIRTDYVNELLACLVFCFNQSINPAKWRALLSFGA